MQLVNRRNLIITGAVVAVLVIIGLLFAAQQARNQSNTASKNGTETVTTDKNSGENISTIEGKTPETYGTLPDTPMYLGIRQFLDVGLSSDQLENLKYAFYKYAVSTNPKTKQVSITTDSAIAEPPDANGKATMTFGVVMDAQPKMEGKLVYFDNSLELTLVGSSGKTVFESGTVTDKSVTIQNQ